MTDRLVRCPRWLGPVLILLSGILALLPLLALDAPAQQTGTLSVTSVGSGDIESVGDCESGDCFQAVATGTFLGAPVGGGIASFRAISLSDLPANLATDLELTAAISAHAAVSSAHHVWPLTDAEVPDAITLAEASVTAHQAALAITEAQITDLAHTVDTDTFAGYTPTGADLGVVTGTAGGAGICAEWNVDGDLVAAASAVACGAGGGSATSIDADDDGIPEVTSTGRDLNDNGTAEVTYSITAGYFTATSGGSASQGMQFVVPTNDEFRWVIGSSLIADIRGNTGLRALTRLTVDATVTHIPSTQTCADDGAATVGSLSVAVSASSHVRIVSADPDGCDLTLLETGVVDGQLLEIELTSSAGGTVTLPDSPGTQNLAGSWTPGAGDSLTLRYNLTASEWRERARADI